ncbi:AraC-type DNA-binding protein [Pelosinus propionicus DSM 13327]|uniref:AraC-type DNA-binding protein n=1 Tax=Pelosinus propionicus DSM 13327 TaxID=1123291 RepID=A0A1I4QTJ2_9FIRM|nr:AraC-type DNA-binding protein [Pelosinus propionicus DSM 13327]
MLEGVAVIQCFMKPDYISHFKNGKLPRLFSASKIDASYSVYPRILHKHEDMLEIMLVRSGSGVYIVDEKRYSIQKGDIIICNCNVLHDEDPTQSKNLNTYCCTLTNVEITGFDKNCLIHKTACPIVHSNELFETMGNLMGMIYFLLASDIEQMEETCSYLAVSLVALLMQIIHKTEMEDTAKKKSTYELLGIRIKQYIDTHYDEPLTLQSISDAMHINPYYLAHVFKDTIGYSPMRYTMRRRIGEAQSLLITTRYSITQIANIVGYDNPNHFNILFTKYVGMPPNKYRNSYTKEKR